MKIIEYEEHLKKTQPDWESRWENVQELITMASEVDSDAFDPDPSESVDLTDGPNLEEPRSPSNTSFAFIRADILVVLLP